MEALNKYSIKDLENFTGIKAHTIRIWEKRYKILEPDRTDSNIRTYSENELKKILNVAYLNGNGLKISKIADLNDDDIAGKVLSVSSRLDDPEADFQAGTILMSAIRFNEDKFMESLNPFIQSHGFESAYLKFLFPLQQKARILWQTGGLTRAQEQFVRNTIRQTIISEYNQLGTVKAKSPATVAMINPSDAYYENNFLFYRYALKKRRFDVIFTGGVLPASEVVEIHKIRPFNYLVVNSGTSGSEKRILDYFTSIGKSLRLDKIILTDFLLKNEKNTSDRIVLCKDPVSFINKIESLD